MSSLMVQQVKYHCCTRVALSLLQPVLLPWQGFYSRPRNFRFLLRNLVCHGQNKQWQQTTTAGQWWGLICQQLMSAVLIRLAHLRHCIMGGNRCLLFASKSTSVMGQLDLPRFTCQSSNSWFLDQVQLYRLLDIQLPSVISSGQEISLYTPSIFPGSFYWYGPVWIVDIILVQPPPLSSGVQLLLDTYYYLGCG